MAGALSVQRLHFPSDTPIEGCELNPYVLCKRGDGSSTTEDIPEEGPKAADGYFLRSRWYRSVQKHVITCSVHSSESAQVQCMCCVRLGVAARHSFHCSTTCFQKAWREHVRLHEEQAAANGPASRGGTPAGRTKTNYGGENGGPGGFSPGAALTRQDSSGGPLNGVVSEEDDNEEWIEVGTSRSYRPEPEDVGHILKFEVTPCESGTGKACGPHQSVKTSCVIAAPEPPGRRMLAVNNVDSPAVQRTLYGRFTVLSYNVLAELYATNEMFGYCPSWALGWGYRRRNLLKEILKYGADIVCLQEVQSDHFEDFFQPEMAKEGYSAVFKKKTREMYSQNTFTMDGCATFYRRDKFVLVKKYEVEFNKAAMSLSETLPPNEGKAAMNRLMKDNIALIVVLEALDQSDNSGRRSGQSRQLLCVANTHINANPELKDVKLWQVHTLLKGLEKISASADIPILLVGDFNSVPGSAPHSLLNNGGVEDDHHDMDCDPLHILRPPSKLTHSLPLVSAYTHLSQLKDPHERERHRQMCEPEYGEPRFTNFTQNFSGTLDYVLYTSDSLAPSALLELLDVDTLRQHTALPSPLWSSDHLAIMCEFQYKPPVRQ